MKVQDGNTFVGILIIFMYFLLMIPAHLSRITTH